MNDPKDRQEFPPRPVQNISAIIWLTEAPHSANPEVATTWRKLSKDALSNILLNNTESVTRNFKINGQHKFVEGLCFEKQQTVVLNGHYFCSSIRFLLMPHFTLKEQLKILSFTQPHSINLYDFMTFFCGKHKKIF